MPRWQRCSPSTSASPRRRSRGGRSGSGADGAAISAIPTPLGAPGVPGTPGAPSAPSAPSAPDAPGRLFGSAHAWTSITPYVGPWHQKPRLTQPDMLRRECGLRGLPPLAEVFPARRWCTDTSGGSLALAREHTARPRPGRPVAPRLRRTGERAACARLRLPLRARSVRPGAGRCQ